MRCYEDNFFLSSSVNSELLDVINSQSLYRCDIPLKLWVKKVSDAQISLVHILSRISKKKPLAILWFAFFCSTTFMSQKCGCVGALPPFAFLAKKIPLKNREPAKNNNIFSDPSFSIVWCWCKEWLTSWSPVRSVLILGPDSDNELPKMHLHRIELKQEKYYLKHKKSRGPPGPDTFDWRWLRASGLWHWTRLTHVKVTTATSLSTSYSDHLTHLYIRWVH